MYVRGAGPVRVPGRSLALRRGGSTSAAGRGSSHGVAEPGRARTRCACVSDDVMFVFGGRDVRPGEDVVTHDDLDGFDLEAAEWLATDLRGEGPPASTSPWPSRKTAQAPASVALRGVSRDARRGPAAVRRRTRRWSRPRSVNVPSPRQATRRRRTVTRVALRHVLGRDLGSGRQATMSVAQRRMHARAVDVERDTDPRFGGAAARWTARWCCCTARGTRTRRRTCATTPRRAVDPPSAAAQVDLRALATWCRPRRRGEQRAGLRYAH